MKYLLFAVCVTLTGCMSEDQQSRMLREQEAVFNERECVAHGTRTEAMPAPSATFALATGGVPVGGLSIRTVTYCIKWEYEYEKYMKRTD